MGQSPRADIFYGLFLGNEGSWHNDPEWSELPECVTGDFDAAVVAVVAPDLQRPTTEYKYEKPEWKAYFAARDAAKESCPVTIILGGGEDCYDYSLAVKESVTSTDWDSNPLTLRDTPMFNATPLQTMAWGDQLREWAGKLGIPWDKIEAANPEAFRWIIVTSYG